jgi:hypothetical protein
MIHGMIAVRGVLLNLAARNIKRQARIAAHYAIAHLDQGGKAPRPMSQKAKENVIRLVLARVDQTPRSLKSLPGGAIYSTAKKRDRPASGAVLKRKRSRISVAPRDTSPPIIRSASEFADAVGSIARGALLFRDCIRKNRLFHAIGQRSTETTSTETTKRRN